MARTAVMPGGKPFHERCAVLWGRLHTSSPRKRRGTQIRPGSRAVTSWTSHELPSGSLKEKNDP